MRGKGGTSVETTFVDDFSGGVNLLESQYTLPSPFAPPGMWNATLRGRMLVSRFGTILAGTLGAASKYIFYSSKLDFFISQEGTTLYSYTISATNQALAGRTALKTFSTSDKVQCVEFTGLLVVVHPVDGVFTWNGAGVIGAAVTAAVKGSCVCAWQNKVWVGGDPGNPSRVWWSNAGTAATWTTATDFVDLREVNDFAVTAIGVGNGMDVVGRGSMQVFKGTSAYRIYSASTGAYITIDAYRGAATSESVTSVAGHVYFCNFYGIYRLDGDTVVTLSDAIRPDWDFGTTYSNPYTCWAAWDRAYFSNLGSNPTGDASYKSHRHYWELIPERTAWFPHGFQTAGAVYTAPYSATRFAKGTSGPLNSALVLADDQVSVLVMPHHPQGASSSFSTPPVPKDYYTGGAGNSIPVRFTFPPIHKQLKRFALQQMRVQGWAAANSDADVRMYFQGVGEQPLGAVLYSDFRLSDINTFLYQYGSPPVPTGSYTNLIPVITTTPTALQTVTQASGYSYGAADQVLPSVGITSFEARVAVQE